MTAVYCMLYVIFGTCLTNGQATANDFVDVYPEHAARAPVWIAHNVCADINQKFSSCRHMHIIY
jgi:hypothetical protein